MLVAHLLGADILLKELQVTGGLTASELFLGGVALQIGFGLLEECFAVGQIGLGLPDGLIERSRVNRKQEMTGFYVLSFPEVNVLRLAVDLCPNLDGQVRHHKAAHLYFHGHRFLLEVGHGDQETASLPDVFVLALA